MKNRSFRYQDDEQKTFDEMIMMYRCIYHNDLMQGIECEGVEYQTLLEDYHSIRREFSDIEVPY